MSSTQNVIVPDTVDRQSSTLYDTYSAASGSAIPAEIVLFDSHTVSLNGIGVTNKRTQYSLPDPEVFTVFGIQLELCTTSPADYLAMLQGYCVQLIVADKVRVEGAISQFPCAGGMAGLVGAGVAGTGVAAGSAAVVYFTNGIPGGPLNTFSLDPYPIRLPAGTNWSLKLRGYTGTGNWAAAAWIRAHLTGIHDKARV